LYADAPDANSLVLEDANSSEFRLLVDTNNTTNFTDTNTTTTNLLSNFTLYYKIDSESNSSVHPASANIVTIGDQNKTRLIFNVGSGSNSAAKTISDANDLIRLDIVADTIENNATDQNNTDLNITTFTDQASPVLLNAHTDTNTSAIKLEFSETISQIDSSKFSLSNPTTSGVSISSIETSGKYLIINLSGNDSTAFEADLNITADAFGDSGEHDPEVYAEIYKQKLPCKFDVASTYNVAPLDHGQYPDITWYCLYLTIYWYRHLSSV